MHLKTNKQIKTREPNKNTKALTIVCALQQSRNFHLLLWSTLRWLWQLYKKISYMRFSWGFLRDWRFPHTSEPLVRRCKFDQHGIWLIKILIILVGLLSRRSRLTLGILFLTSSFAWSILVFYFSLFSIYINSWMLFIFDCSYDLIVFKLIFILKFSSFHINKKANFNNRYTLKIFPFTYSKYSLTLPNHSKTLIIKKNMVFKALNLNKQ